MRRPYTAIPVLIVFAALLFAAAWTFNSRFEKQSSFRDQESETLSFAGYDWVTWEDSEQGVVASHVHPLIQGNPLLRDRYIRKGDILKRIDYQDIYKAEVVNRIVRNAAPGTVLLVQVERPGKEDVPAQWHSLFIENSILPQFTIRKERFLWASLPWLLILGTFLALVSILTIFPIIRPSLKENWPLLGVLVLSFLVFGIMALRHLNLLVSNDYTQPGFEQLFTWIFSILLPLYGGVALFMQLSRWRRWTGLLSIGLVAFIGFRGYQAIFLRPFALYTDLIENFVLFAFLLHVFFLLVLSVIRLWRRRSRMDKLFHILSILYAGPLLVLYLGSLMGWESIPATGDISHFFVFGAVLIPMISTAVKGIQ